MPGEQCRAHPDFANHARIARTLGGVDLPWSSVLSCAVALEPMSAAAVAKNDLLEAEHGRSRPRYLGSSVFEFAMVPARIAFYRFGPIHID
jgi:hypothetical protein